MRARHWWGVVVLFVLLSLIIIRAARGATPNTSGATAAAGHPATTQVAGGDDFQFTERLLRVEQSLADIEIALARLPTWADYGRLEDRTVSEERRLTTLRAVVDLDRSDAALQLDREIARVANDVAQIGAALDAQRAEETRQVEALEGRVFSAIDRVSSRAVEAVQAERRRSIQWAQAREDTFDEQERSLLGKVALLAITGGLTVALVAVGRIHMQKRLRHVEQATLWALCERSSPRSLQEPEITELQPRREPGKTGVATDIPGIKPARPSKISVPSPAEQMDVIIREAAEFRHLRVKPKVASDPWAMGLATMQGHVRSENQDYGLCFDIGGYDVLVIADGCGGVPHGQRASYLAVVSAAVSVVRSLNTASRSFTQHLEDTAAGAIMKAAHRLAVEGDKMNITDVRGGLRTTLIVVIASRCEVGYAYIGDGGGWVVRPSGEVQRFLQPQKASEFGDNVLAASLGPTMEGEPVVGVLPRGAGDLLVVGTDGVFDRVTNGFAKDVLRGAIERHGDLQATAEQVTSELAAFKDEAGYVCDDNLTLGILGDRAAPKLAPGFWAAASLGEDQPAPLGTPESGSCMREVRS
jgi:serine/threonine protein phosphatase PrpC